MKRLLTPVALLAVAAAAPIIACSDTPATPASAFSGPIDFSWACEGEGRTIGPANDETAASLSATRMCADVTQVVAGQAAEVRQGDLFGLVVNRHPAGVVVLQLNPATGERRFLDTNAFIPGVTPIPVGRNPIRIIRQADFGAFYVLSAGDRDVTRIVIQGYVEDVAYDSQTFLLPGIPSDGLMVGEQLVVSAADAAQLWVFDVAADPVDPPLSVVDLPDRVQSIVATGEILTVTWAERPLVSRLALDGTILAEAPVVEACRDTLDNDGDGLTDKQDPDCRYPEDDDEGASGVARPETIPEAAPGFAEGAALCDNGVDDDGDGFTDFPADAACDSADDDGEGLSECEDGIDNDGDGVSDADDPSCYTAETTVERRLPRNGPFQLTVVEAGAAGSFVYVLDQRIGEILVFEVDDEGLSRVDVNAADTTPPLIETTEYGAPGGEVTEHAALAATRPIALQRSGERNIVLTQSAVTSLTTSRLRGEIWDRLIEGGEVALGSPSGLWLPDGCDPARTDVCAQPAGDDASWYVFGSRVDGRIQLIEAVRRGQPMHRTAQSRPQVEARGTDLTTPRLTVRGRLLTSRGEPQQNHAFIGAAIEELLSDTVEDEAPARLRRFGIWPVEDLEQVVSESWTVTYEGKIPGADGVLGRMTSDTTLFDANARFCEDGVMPGDWLALTVPTESTSPALRHELAVIDSQDRVCPTVAPDELTVEVQVSEVGMTSLEIDVDTARLRPGLPLLDEDEIDAQGLSVRACEQALIEVHEVLGLPDNLAATDAFAASALPERFSYAVRTAGQWTLVGFRSGFLHRQVWDRDSGSCIEDEGLDARLTGRHEQAPDAIVNDYEACPPPPEQLTFDAIEQLTPESERFVGTTLSLDILPGCQVDDSGVITAAPSQQDTVWSFAITGPDSPQTLAVGDSRRTSLLGTRVPTLEFRRQLVQLDAAANRASLLQVRPEAPSIIAIFE